ncbi:hypothetical protein A3F64_01250 [Candidatus Saccharibacteria bacterium RIFCSPHIGHO2_12_FULL_42_8]|nr:MAG: hypothetical protein A3F64_01250 [Candidatus Saccharibacteria bacterium RIFCSPHIGHO2_12_FULL_42_8]
MRIFSYVKKITIVLPLLALTLSPSTVLARESGVTEQAVEPKKTITNSHTTESKCLAIDKIVSKVHTQLDERKSKVESKRASLAAESSSKQAERDKELATKRAEWDAQRQENFQRLRSKAVTSAQKEAVENYVAAISEAISVRRSANDAAHATYRAELEALKATLKQSVETNISTTSSNISQAISDAKAACESGESSVDTIRQNLKKALEEARTQSKTNRQSTVKSEQLKAIVNKRNESVKANAAAFEQATKEARENLKAAITN